MMNHDKFKKDDYKCLCDTIKDEMKSWQESCDYISCRTQGNIKHL